MTWSTSRAVRRPVIINLELLEVLSLYISLRSNIYYYVQTVKDTEKNE